VAGGGGAGGAGGPRGGWSRSGRRSRGRAGRQDGAGEHGGGGLAVGAGDGDDVLRAHQVAEEVHVAQHGDAPPSRLLHQGDAPGHARREDDRVDPLQLLGSLRAREHVTVRDGQSGEDVLELLP
jgi:hypothetical protein